MSLSQRPPNDRSLVLAPLEIPIGHELSCDHYTPHFHAQFSSLYFAAQWELANLALFHRAAYKEVVTRDAALDAYADEIPRHPPNDLNDDSREYFYLIQSRMRERLLSAEQEAAAIAGYADEMLIVGLWSLTEKYLGRGLRLLPGRRPNHRWPDLVAEYLAAGFDLTVQPGARGADECRLLNNAIKHSGVVGSPLAATATFSMDLGREIRDLNLDVQRYLLAVHHLVGSTLELCDYASAGEPVRPFKTDLDGRTLRP